ncbi:MAG: hypothetical protein LPK02_01740 [Rhodobacterales bacterium]|nr:hypothetical protein [Rhodobacterales bacterium]MDX5411753.1 hypothetical protein [Rhodobacterales bacterium]
MLRYLLAALAATAIGLAVWWAMALRMDNAALRTQNAALIRTEAALRQQLDHSRLAREVEIARAERWRARAGDLSARIETFLTGDIPDATLDPDLADLLNRLREID